MHGNTLRGCDPCVAVADQFVVKTIVALPIPFGKIIQEGKKYVWLGTNIL
jgi:hypothetical protein